MHQLEETQWLPAEEILRQQHRQLVNVISHAQQHSPHFRERLQSTGLSIEELATAEGLRRLPVMTRRDIQAAGPALFCRQLPNTHLPVGETRTSGSSGEPVVVQRTSINQLFWLAITLREHLWKQRVFSGKLAIIRASHAGASEQDHADWGVPVNMLFSSGTAHALKMNTDIRLQIEWLARLNPDYLITYPTNLSALLRELGQHGGKLTNLRQIRTIGETLSGDLREQTRKILHVDIADIYSSQELGTMAIQCPESDQYHIMAEAYIVEVLDDQDRPCAPGQIGRLVITDLHNFATPLIRYQIADYAEAGARCACARG